MELKQKKVEGVKFIVQPGLNTTKYFCDPEMEQK